MSDKRRRWKQIVRVTVKNRERGKGRNWKRSMQTIHAEFHLSDRPLGGGREGRKRAHVGREEEKDVDKSPHTADKKDL